MKRNLTFLLTALLLLTGMNVWAQSRTSITDVLNRELTGVTGSSYTSWEGKTSNSDAVYAGQSAGGNESIQLRSNNSNSGIITTASGGTVTNVTVTWNENTADGRTLNVYGSHSVFTSPTELYDNDTQVTLLGTIVKGTSTELEITDSYEFLGLRSASGAMYLQEIDITWNTEGGTPQETVATPTFNPQGGTYSESVSVTISCATEGVSIYYTTDGSNPTESSIEYTSAINITETTTVKAIAMKEGYLNSNIASATYTIDETPSPTLITIAEARTLNNNEYALVQGVVTFLDGRNVYIQDATAGIDLYLNSNTVPTSLAIGDIVSAYGSKTVYRGLVELSGINGGNADEFSILSSGNELPLANQTIENINADFNGANMLQSTRVKIENAVVGTINTNGTTVITQGGNNLNVYRIPAVEGMVEGDIINLIGIIGCYDNPQLRVVSANDIEIIHNSSLIVSPTTLSGFEYEYETGGPSEIQYFFISGDQLTHDVSVIPSENFEVSTQSIEQFVPENPAMIYIPTSGVLYGIQICVRLKAGLEAGTYNEQIAIVSDEINTAYVSVSGIVTGTTPTPPEPPTPGDGNYVRISDLSQLVAGSYVVIAARFDENAADYYAMTNASSGKPAGVLFTSTNSDAYEVLPASITDEESNYYWIVGVTANGYTFTNANGELIGYENSTNFSTNGNNTEWAIELGTADNGAMVPEYSGFFITNVNNAARHFALNSSYNFGPYHSNNLNNSGYNFYLDIFVKTEGIEPPTPTVATPNFAPVAGTYTEAQNVSITCSTQGATIYYSTISENGPWNPYLGVILVEESMTIWAYAVMEGYNDSPVAEASYIIQAGSGSVTIFNQDWEGEMNGWTFVNVDGEMSWTVAQYSGNHYAYANGYSAGSAHANEDWCISPAFDLSNVSNAVLTFRTATKFTGPVLEVYFSNNYDGEDPNASGTTWIPLTGYALSQGNYEWVESGPVSLASLSGTNCHIAFKYTSTDTEAASWEVDDVMLVSQTSASVVTVTPTALTGFNYIESNGPSAEQSFTISGFNLSSNIVVTPGTNYEISLTSGNGFTLTPITLSPIGGNIEETTIYVRLKAGLAVGDYNENIVISCSDVENIQVSCNGSVTAQPIPGDDYVRISGVSELMEGNRVILAARYNETANAYFAISNTLTSGKLPTTEFTSTMNEGEEIIPSEILSDEDNYYWTVGITADGYTFTNSEGQMIGYGNSGTNFVMDSEKTVWTIETGISDPASLVPGHYGFNIINATTTGRGMALRVTDANSVVGAYAVSNMANGEYNFFLDIFMQGEGGTCTVAAPTFSPIGGTYYETQDITISCSTSDATIYYSLESASGPWEEYEEAITVDESMTIWAYAEKEGCNDSPVVNAEYIIQTGSGSVTIFNQDWEGEMNGWTFVTVQGDKPWNVSQYQGNHYAYANGYNGGVNEQWCISPAFNINDYQNVILTFRNAKNYTGPNLELKYSTNYDGVDPTAADWWTFDFNMSPGSYTWVESGNIPISIYPAYSTNCYIAFKYTSNETEAAAWEVDDITLVGDTEVPNLTATPSSLSGFTHVVGEGPSASQYFTLSGVNIGPAPGGGSTGSIVIQSSENEFEVSLDNETFSWQVDIDGINGTLPPTPVYVRMNGTEVGQYTATVTIHASSSDEASVALSGTVTPQPIPGDDYVRISGVSDLTEGNRVILAARYNETANDYYAIGNTLASGKLPTTEFTSAMNGGDEIIPSEILSNEDNYYWTVGITADGYTFTNSEGQMIGYGNSGTNFVMDSEKTVWTIEAGTSDPASLVPDYYGFNIINATTTGRGMALRVTDANSVVGAYAVSNMANGEYNFFLDIFMQGEGGPCTVAAPTFNPAGGTYYEPQEVTISCATEGATIWYSLISGNGPWTPYTGAISVDEFASIWAYASKEGCNDSPVVHADYIIQNDLVIIFNQDWENDWQGWTERCVYGDSLWRIASYQGNHYAYANGYNHPATEDWLISPAFDLDSYSDVVLTFRTAMNYTGPELELFFSNDYDGQNPTLATWQEIEFEHSLGSWNWVPSGDISLDGFSGSNCYIGFRYRCSDDEAAGWEVDDIMLVSGSTIGGPTLTATPNSLSGFSYVIGNGPSNSQSYALTGANLEGEGNINITACEYFEISLDGEEFHETLTIPFADGIITGQPVTIYVRLIESLEIGNYACTITHEGGNASTLVNVSGAVLSENEPFILSIMPNYIQGNNGSNNNRVPVAVPVDFFHLSPNTTYRYTNQFVDENDGPETAGAGNVIYASPEGFYRSTSPSLATEGGYGEFTTDEDGSASVWLINEPTANARFTPGNHVYLRARINDGNEGTNVDQIFTSNSYATVLNFGTENDEYSGTAFYVKSEEAPMNYALLYDSDSLRPMYSTCIEATGVDYGSINQYADFYKEFVAGNDGWFGGILPNINETGITHIIIMDSDIMPIREYTSEDGQWSPNANTVNPTNGLDEPIFIDLTDDGVEEAVVANVKVWSTDHEFVIENGDNAHYSMTVYNVLGQPVMMKQINAGRTERISHSLTSGVYIISLQNNQSKVSVKVIVR